MKLSRKTEKDKPKKQDERKIGYGRYKNLPTTSVVSSRSTTGSITTKQKIPNGDVQKTYNTYQCYYNGRHFVTTFFTDQRTNKNMMMNSIFIQTIGPVANKTHHSVINRRSNNCDDGN